MKAYIITLIVLFSLEIIGKSVWLAKQDFVRTANSIIVDILLLVAFIIWGVFVVASN